MTENVLEDKVAHMEENLWHTESHIQEMYVYQLDPAFIEDKLIDLDDQLRWNNLRIDDTKERPKKTWADCKMEPDTSINESLGIEKEVVIERTHRVKTAKSKKANTPRTIVCRI